MGVALLAGPANVIMELARPGVGYGVLESRVESGRADRHPIKRARTTFTYLAVARRGTDEQKKAYSRAVSGSHAQVYSTRTARSSTTPSTRTSSCGWPPASTRGAASTSTASSSARWTTRPPTSSTGGQDAGHHPAGAGAHVARRPPGLRPLLAGVAGEGAHRRRGSGVPVPHRGVLHPRCPAARAASAGRRGIQPADHQRVPAAEIPR